MISLRILLYSIFFGSKYNSMQESAWVPDQVVLETRCPDSCFPCWSLLIWFIDIKANRYKGKSPFNLIFCIFFCEASLFNDAFLNADLNFPRFRQETPRLDVGAGRRAKPVGMGNAQFQADLQWCHLHDQKMTKSDKTECLDIYIYMYPRNYIYVS